MYPIPEPYQGFNTGPYDPEDQVTPRHCEDCHYGPYPPAEIGVCGKCGKQTCPRCRGDNEVHDDCRKGG